jgi:hypothetical protein
MARISDMKRDRHPPVQRNPDAGFRACRVGMLVDAGGPHGRHRELVLRVVVLGLLSLVLRAYF